MSEQKIEPKVKDSLPLEKKDFMKIFWRSFTLLGSMNYERMQALGYDYSIMPALKKIYNGNKEQLSESLSRNMEVFNTTVAPSTFIMGLSVAMEEKNAKDKNFDPKAISAVKMALMGPIAGIGDSFFWGVFRVIAAGIGVSFALKGSILGPIIFLILYNIPHFLVRYYGLFLGYEKGNSFLKSMNDTGKMELITYCAGILGVLVIGSMVGTMVTIKTPLVLNLQGAKVNFQQIFDQILPQALPLGATLLTYSLLKKRVNINYIMIGIFAIGIIGSLIGIL